MRKRIRCGLLLAIALTAGVAVSEAPQRPIPSGELRSGVDFTGPDARALQQDDFANPGVFWVELGERLWRQSAGSSGKSCESCHGDARTSMKGVATRYPLLDRGTGRLLNLEGRIMQCTEQRQRAPPLAYESEALLALTTYVRHQSRGMPVSVTIDSQARSYFEKGRALYYQRMGQMNLSCANCHQENWGRNLGPETISQGHGSDYPVYRLEWQTLGSLQRRFRSCFSGVRAEMLPYGAPEYLDLELYLAWRGNGLPIETPGVRP